MSTPLILAYHLAPERAARIRTLCAVEKLRMKQVLPQEESLPVGVLAGILPPQEAPAAGVEEISGEMLVLCQLPESTLDRFLQGFRRMNIPPVALKAVLTPTNALWTGSQLFAELQREHQALNR